MSKRFIALLLSLILSSSAMISCSESKENADETQAAGTDTTAQAADPSAENTEETKELTALELRQQIPDDLPAVTFDGRSFKMGTDATKEYEIRSEELTGENTNDEVYERNIRIEDRFDTKIEAVVVATPYNDVVTAATAGTASYDMVGFINFEAEIPIAAKALYNWFDIPVYNPEKPWHNELANSGSTINNKRFTDNSDLSISTLLYTYGMFFNYQIMERYNYTSEDLYNIVFEGGWTIDKFNEITNTIYEDANGNGVHDNDDVHGYIITSTAVNTHDVWLGALNLPTLTIITPPDEFTIDLFNERTITGVEKVLKLYYESDGTLVEKTSGNWRTIPSLFAQSKAAMTQLYFGETTESLTEMEDTYGILPMPKLDELQEGYYTNAWDQFTVFAVPLTMPEEDGQFIGTLYEAMCAESYKFVYPAYYDQALKSRYSAEPTTAQIIDLIMEGRKLDFTFQFGSKLNSLPYMFRGWVVNNTTNIASQFKRNQKALNKNVEKLLEDIFMDD